MIELEPFLEQENVLPLLAALINWSNRKTTEERQDILKTASLPDVFFTDIRFDTTAQRFAQALVAKFKTYSFSVLQPDYHPMVNLLNHLCERKDLGIDQLADPDYALFQQLVKQGQEKLKALAARSAVGQIESPKKTGIGTGILVAKDLLLTCYHIFSKAQVQQAWVRFNYYEGNFLANLDVSVFELDGNWVKVDPHLDYVLVKIKGQPQQTIAKPANAPVDIGQEIRLIHHPAGKPVQISQLGQIIDAEPHAYLDHQLETDYGSSGAPIFNRNWELVAIHRGELGSRHPAGLRPPGTMSATPIYSFWDTIKEYLT